MQTDVAGLKNGRAVLKTRHRAGAASGFTLVEIMIVVAIIGLLVSIVIPQWQRYRKIARVKVCVANLRQLDHAKAQWAFETRKSGGDVPIMTDLTPYIQRNETPACPADGTYDLRQVSQFPSCSLASEGHSLDDPVAQSK